MANNDTKNRKAILVTPEVSIGCRACQVACKSWNELPGIKTKNSGTYQNPPDLEGECEAVCPKEITLTNIAFMNRSFIKARLFKGFTPLKVALQD